MTFRNSAATLVLLSILMLPHMAMMHLPFTGGMLDPGGWAEDGGTSWEVTMGADAEGVTQMPDGKTQIYMAENLELSAEKPDQEAPLKVQVPDSFIPTTPRGFFGRNEEQHVGIWNSNQIRMKILTAGKITFRFWVWDERSHSGNFNLSLYKNEDPMNIVATATINANSIDSNPRMYQTIVPLSLNNTEFIPGDRLSLAIKATVNGGCYILYGTPDRDTSMIIQTDSLTIEKLKADTGGFEIWYQDAFGVKPSSMVFYAEADNRPLSDEELIQRQITMESLSVIIRWPKHLMAGVSHEFVAAVTYGGVESTNISIGPLTINIKSHEHHQLIPTVVLQFLVVIILLVFLWVAVSRLRRYRRDQMLMKVRMHRMRRQLIDSGILPPNANMADVRRYLIRTGQIQPRGRKREVTGGRGSPGGGGAAAGQGGYSQPAAPPARRGGARDDVPEAVVLEPIED